MTRVHSHLHVYTAIPQIIIQNVIIRAVKYGSNLRTSSISITSTMTTAVLIRQTLGIDTIPELGRVKLASYCQIVKQESERKFVKEHCLLPP